MTRPFVTIFGRYCDDECYHHAYFLDNSLKLTPLSDTNQKCRTSKDVAPTKRLPDPPNRLLSTTTVLASV